MSSVTGRQLLSLQLGNFLPEGRYLDVDPTTGLIILANNNFVYLLDSRTGEYRGVYQAKTQVVAIKYCCPDYNRLLIAGETSTQILHLPTMSVIKSTKLSSASGKDERKESIKSADWHSNEPVIAVGTDSGKLRIWDLRKEVEDMCQVGSKRETLCWLEFSPNLVDRNLLAIGIIGRVVIYDWMSSNACRSINVRGELQSICWSPEIDLGLLSDSNGVAAQHSRYLAIGCNITGGTGQVNICQPHSGQIVREIRVKIPLTGRAHLPLIWLEQCCLAVINNREINIFDLSRKPNVNPVTKSPFGHLKTVLGMVATSDCFVTFGMDRQLIIWDRNTLDIRQRVPFVSFAEICCLEVSTDGSLVTYAASTDAERSKGPREIGLWRVGSRSQWYDHIFNWFNLSSSLILCLSFHPGLDGSVLYGMADGKYGVMALRGQANDRSPEKSYLFAHCFGAGHPVFQVASSPNPSAFWLLAEGKIYQQSVKRINDPPQEVKLPSKNEMISRFAFNSTFTRLAVGYRAGVVEVFSVHPDIRLLWNFELPLTDNNVVVHLAFHPTRPLLAAADVNKLGIVYVYEMPDSLSEMNLKPSVKFDTHGKKVQSITWSPGETANLAVAFGGAPPKAGVIVYNYDRREVLGFYRGHQRRPRCVRFNPDNPDELFSAGDDGFVLRWRLSDLKRNLSSPTPPVEIGEFNNK